MNRITLANMFLAVLLSSCTHYYYVANVQNVPLFREKNEFRFSGTAGNGDESNYIELQSAYSISDKIGIMANFMSASGGAVSDNSYGKGNYLDGAIGYYKPIGKSGVFEIYGGLGGSRQHHQYEKNSTADLSFTKLFVQPSFGLTFKPFDIAFSTRICRLAFNSTDNNSYLYNPNNLSSDRRNELNTVVNKNHFFLEPALTIRAGWKNVKLQFQAEYANVSGREDLNFVEKQHISLGLIFAIADRYKKK